MAAASPPPLASIAKKLLKIHSLLGYKRTLYERSVRRDLVTQIEGRSNNDQALVNSPASRKALTDMLAALDTPAFAVAA